MKVYWWSRSIAPLLLNLDATCMLPSGQRHAPVALLPKNCTLNGRLGGCPTDGLDAVEKRKISLLWRDSKPRSSGLTLVAVSTDSGS